MIGIMYPSELLHRLRHGKRSFERPSLYLEAAREAGEEVIFFSPPDIQWKKGTVLGWNGSSSSRKREEIPSVIINRTRSNLRDVTWTVRRLKRLGKRVFNERNVVSKLAVHRILWANEALHPYLPETASASRRSIHRMLRSNENLFLKPKRASVGNGIIRIRKTKDTAYAEVNVLGRTVKRKVGTRTGRILKLLKGRRRSYLVQQGIPLMNYKGDPVDFRVSVQKDGGGKWQCTGIVGKVARKNAIVTNLHCGGKSIRASKLFDRWGWDAEEMERKIASLGVSVAETLEHRLPGIADLGLDIAVDEQRHPWFIEANFRDLRITFRNAGEREVWRATFANPVRYAAYLKKQKKDHDLCKPQTAGEAGIHGQSS